MGLRYAAARPAMCSAKAAVPHLEVRLLGELEVIADGVKLALPQSKKTRALLGYLLLTGHAHRRDRLCSLLWDVADDPRAALRWSLSKLRELVDTPNFKRVSSDREHIALDTGTIYVDALEMPRLLGPQLQNTAPEALRRARELFRGELLEGIDLDDFHGFSAWLLAERRRFRELHRRVLSALIEHSGGHPERVLPFVRELVQIDPGDESARAKLLEVLHATGAIGEAHEAARANKRLMGSTSPASGLPSSAAQLAARAEHEPQQRQEEPPRRSSIQRADDASPLLGRAMELAALQSWLDDPAAKLHAWLFEGEAGMGKSRLLRACEHLAEGVGARCVRVRVPDARPGWPYAALQSLLAKLDRDNQDPLHQLVEASAPQHSNPAPLAASLTTAPPPVGAPHAAALVSPTPLISTQPTSTSSAPGSLSAAQAPSALERASAAVDHEALMRAVQAVLERAADAHSPLLLLLDDVHFLDEASITLLHFCALNLRARRIGLVLSARSGELHDRPSLARTMRALRREQILEQRRLSPLSFEQTRAVLGPSVPHASAQQLFEWSGGNPLFALMLRDGEAKDTTGTLPRSIAQLVQDRVSNLPAEHTDVLRWAAVLGAVFRTDQLQRLVGLDDEALVEALESLERHGWLGLQADAAGHARFTHQIVQRALYDQLSEPRKRLMHAKVAQLLAAKAHSAPSATLEDTALLAHHAVLGGDRTLAVRACQSAAQRCIRVYAHADAVNLARRGLAQAAQLPEPEQVCLALELHQLLLHARLPDSPEEVLPELVRLTERALDLGAVGHAHLGFHLRAFVKWEHGDCSDALRYSREVERISRLAAPEQRAQALADSARCLAQLERDLSDAEAFVNEAELLADASSAPAGLPLARGILTLFRGDHALAASELPHARQLAARAGNRLEEFYALEFCVYLELAREQYQAALALCGELTSTAERLRGGSEVPFARTLEALVRLRCGLDSSLESFDEQYAELAAQDAKQRCAFLSAEAAHFAAISGDHMYALRRAQEALQLASAVERASESALALSVIVRAQHATGSPSLQESCAALCACLDRPISAFARRRAEAALALVPSAAHLQESVHGNRDRRARVRPARGR